VNPFKLEKLKDYPPSVWACLVAIPAIPAAVIWCPPLVSLGVLAAGFVCSRWLDHQIAEQKRQKSTPKGDPPKPPKPGLWGSN
jgi:hypothetical protein